MNNVLAALAIVVLTIVLVAAVATDLRSRRIPNILVLAGLAGAFTLHAGAWLIGSTPLAGARWWSPFAGLAAGLAVLVPLYLLRACGAGDVKLMAVVGAFVGAKLVLAAALYTVLAGGVLALLFMLGRGVAAQTLANVRVLLSQWRARMRSRQGVQFEPLQHTAARLPYAVAITTGTLIALRWPPGAA
jgi:prepilin peptidase CpaA